MRKRMAEWGATGKCNEAFSKAEDGSRDAKRK